MPQSIICNDSYNISIVVLRVCEGPEISVVYTYQYDFDRINGVCSCIQAKNSNDC